MMRMVRPRLYSKSREERMPKELRVSAEAPGRAKFLKSLTGARNTAELVDIAFDALQEKITRKKLENTVPVGS